MDTLLLDRTTWDLVLDVSGNIAVASNPYSLSQDAASEVRVLLGELWYDTTRGNPYFRQAGAEGQHILGAPLNVPLVKTRLSASAALVPETSGAAVFLSSFQNRKLGGQVQVVDASTGKTSTAAF